MLSLTAIAPTTAHAQFGGTLFGPPSQQFAPPNPVGSPPPAAPAARAIQTAPAAPTAQNAPQLPAGQSSLAVSARFGRDISQPINSGLLWRVYPAKPDASRAYKPVKEERSASPVFQLPPGDYVVHVTFGLASAAKAVSLRGEAAREVFDLSAGGIRLEGRVADVRIPAGQINFDIYRGSQFDTGDRQPIANNVTTGEVVVVPEGTYYIVSNYGDSNAVVRSDIRVQAGKLTDVAISHRAAAITLKLAARGGGDALANTEWTVLTPGGDVVKESTGAFPKVILAEGEYRAIARNEGKMYERSFKVTTGVDGEIEVLTR
ncbi:MAG: hypothetical protein ACXWKA_08040 [Xanthobacteraceae bacterium]